MRIVSSITPERHWSFGNLDMLWQAGMPFLCTTPGTPWCRLEFEPTAGLVRLVTPWHGREPEISHLRFLDADLRVENGVDVMEVEVSVRACGLLHPAYSLVVSVADDIQLRGWAPADALAEAVACHGALFAGRRGLSREQEVGLIGELFVLEHLVDVLGPDQALSAWVGPASEEHDFAFGDVRVECKTTTNERRVHVISGLTQLVPLPDTSLVLLSNQATRAGTGGRTLPELVTAITSLFPGLGERVRQLLQGAGWCESDSGLYQSTWSLRSTPRCYLVDDRFPALTPCRIEAVVADSELISDVRYSVDVTGMTPSPPPAPLVGYADS